MKRRQKLHTYSEFFNSDCKKAQYWNVFKSRFYKRFDVTTANTLFNVAKSKRSVKRRAFLLLLFERFSLLVFAVGSLSTSCRARVNLRNDNLTRSGVVRVGNRMIKQADGAHNLARLLDAICAGNVARITVELLAFGRLAAAAHANDASVLRHELVDRLIEHIRAAVDCRKARKALRQLAESIEPKASAKHAV